nr:MAG TPA: LRV protein FeS4 cluster [Caudoviricetes sp.]
MSTLFCNFLSAFRVERRFLFFPWNPACAHDFPRHFRKSTKMMVG